jgi:hypothetical protein
MVNQGRVPRTGKISGDSHRIQGIDKVLARGMLLVEMLPVAIDLQLLTGEEEIWRPVVTHLAGMLVVVGAIQCSPGSQTPLMVWIEAEKTLKCRVIVEAPVARACRRHPVAAEVAPVAAEEDTPAVVEVAHVAAAEVAAAVAVGAVAGDNL